MQILKLAVENFRILSSVSLQFSNKINCLVGENGAGKTSLLESLVVLAKGRSFRGGQIEDLIGPKAENFTVHAKILSSRGIKHQVGLTRGQNQWRARLDQQDVKNLSDLSVYLPLVIIEPNSHRLVDGPPQNRRRFLDWGVFHVKPDYLGHWRRYRRSLKQRNAALKSKHEPKNELLDSLDTVLAESGHAVHQLRASCFNRLKDLTKKHLDQLSPGFPALSIQYSPGWTGNDLYQWLVDHRARDLKQENTGGGPHRADLQMRCGDQKASNYLSRGQQKMLATALLLAEAELLDESRSTPLLLLDDLSSEYDQQHLGSLLNFVNQREGQTWITSVDQRALDQMVAETAETAMFHVKHGTIEAA